MMPKEGEIRGHYRKCLSIGQRWRKVISAMKLFVKRLKNRGYDETGNHVSNVDK